MGRVLSVTAFVLAALLAVASTALAASLEGAVSIDELCSEKNLSEWRCNMIKQELSKSNLSLTGGEAGEDGEEPEQDAEDAGAVKKKKNESKVRSTPKRNDRGVSEGDPGEESKKDDKKTLFDRYVKDYSPIEFKGGLKPFGYDVFENADLKKHSKHLPVADDYVLGPGDEVVVFMWGRLNGRYNLTVGRDGVILIPDVGPLPVAGMTFSEMKKLLHRKVGDIIGTEITVTVGRLRSIQVFVLGEVKHPGPYTVSAMSTITDGVIASGGPSGIGSLRKVSLKRDGKEIAELDFYDLFLRGDKSKDRRLQDGDVIFVPTVGPLVGIVGNVRRPAVYELKEAAGLKTLFKLAGGVIPTAYTLQVQVERVEGNSKRVVVDINALKEGGADGFTLQDADLVKVFSIYDRDMNAVYIDGNVKMKGKVELKEGMRLSDVIKGPDDLLDETFFDYGVVKRVARPSGDVRIIPFSLGGLFSGSTADNITLEPKDSIYVFSKWVFNDHPSARVEGEVRVASSVALARLPGSVDPVELNRLKAGYDPVKGQLSFSGVMKDEERKSLLGLIEITSLKKNTPEKSVSKTFSELAASDPAAAASRLMDTAPKPDGEPGESEPVETARTSEAAYMDAVNRLYAESNAKGVVEIVKGARIKDLIFKAGGLTREASYGESELYRTDKRTNQVTLMKFDLGKAMEGDPESNLVVQDMDRVVIHSVTENEPDRYVVIKGEVNKPGKYRYAKNMKISDLVFAAGSILESAHLGEAELATRTEGESGSAITILNVDVGKAVSGSAADDMPLKPDDILFIKKIPNWGEERFVSMEGEVRFPGKYLIKKGEKLSSLIERAGGFTDRAYLKGAIFSRESVRKLQQRNLDDSIDRLERRMIVQSSESIEKSVTMEAARQEEAAAQQRKQLIIKMREARALGRMVVKLGPAEEMKGSPYDVLLEDGDKLVVPWRYSVLNVSGAVVNPTSFIYDPGVSVSEYIRKSGGATESADVRKAYVIKVDGSALSAENLKRWKAIDWNDDTGSWEFGSVYSRLDPGDTIVVPERTERIAWLREVKDMTQILYQIAVTAGVLIVAF